MLPHRIDRAVVNDHIGRYADEQATFDERAQIYRELLGFVPPRIEARLAVTGGLDPKIVGLQEQLREHAMYPACFDVKTAQLMLFGMLLMDMNDAVFLHGIAARRAGATWQELQAVVNLCFLFRGLSAANRGAELLARLAEREHADAAATTTTPN